MLTLLTLALIAAAPDPPPGAATPDALYRAAYADLVTNVPPHKRHTARYVTLHAWPQAEHFQVAKALTYACNATSFRGRFGVLTPVPGTPLLRVDLESFGWDYGSRAVRLADLEKRGVDFGLKVSEDRRLFLDPWESFAKDDPYFFASSPGYRGWIDPRVEEAARLTSFSLKFVLRADWLLPRLLQEKQFGGAYSTLLMLPPKEADLYKVFGVDINLVERDNQLRRGGAVLSSIVALHNRELQLIPSLYPAGEGFIWRTFDTNVDARGDKSVLEAFAGTVKHDGREIIGTLPNGTFWYYLANGAGAQAAVVPEDIAQVKRPLLPVRETRVVNSYKCLECHGPAGGIHPFDDVVSRTILDPTVSLSVYGDKYNKDQVAAKRELLEDYYLSPLGATIRRQNERYAEQLKEGCGMTGLEVANSVVGLVEAYTHDLVDPAQAAREMGLPIETARVAWRLAAIPRKEYSGQVVGSPHLAALSAGQPIRRAAFEQSWAEAMQAVHWPYEAAVAVPARGH